MLVARGVTWLPHGAGTREPVLGVGVYRVCVVSRDVRKIGHFGTGDLKVTSSSEADFERAKPLFGVSYDAS